MYKISSELEELASKVIKENDDIRHLENAGCRICYLYCDKEKKSNGKTIFADTRKVDELMKVVSGYDFLITFYLPNCQLLTEEKMDVLMHHELKHVGYDGEDGRCYIVPHDVEDFKSIIDKYGVNWTE